MSIRDLFDQNRSIERKIEKVITYGTAQEDRLYSEISEYEVTDSIEDHFQTLLNKMQTAMESGEEHEIGVWVSGFYGSGKSSFTKYFGLAFDSHLKVKGTPFLEHLRNRLNTAQVKAQLNTVVQRFPAAVVMLDLASEMLAGATMEDVSTVLYFKVLQWAGYSRNLKVAALEHRLEKDGRLDDFRSRIETELPGLTWAELQNDPLVVDDLVPRIAHEMYPALFSTPNAFTSSTEGFYQHENERVKEMIDIVRKKSGKENVIFIVDEVGQYVAPRSELILNLDGLAKNIKAIGLGKVWLFSTAQQTLTEDDTKAFFNSAELFKLKDRFPIQIDLEAKDIREICYRRLLKKSPAGEAALGELFDKQGPSLKHHTKLENAKIFESDFSRDAFIKLYPFLPAHFDILLHLLGQLAKSTGGLGLRSAIKVIQDLLVEGHDGRHPVADEELGWLATTVTLYDSLEKDIKKSKSYAWFHQAVTKVSQRHTDDPIHLEVAKTIAVLQILGNLPITLRNIASLIHPSVTHPSKLDAVQKALDELLNDPHVPLGEKEGAYCFLSEMLRNIELERSQLIPRTADMNRVFTEALRNCFDPLPKVSLQGTMSVSTGLKFQNGSTTLALAGESHAIQTLVELVPASEYEAAKARLLDESRSSAGKKTISLVAKLGHELQDLQGEICRCQGIFEKHKNDVNQEIKDYCKAQNEKAERLSTQLRAKLKHILQSGSFIFRGEVTAVSTLHTELLDAARKLLSSVAEQVFDRYSEAPVRVETDLAEKFLKAGNPKAIHGKLDPLEFVILSGGSPTLRTDHKAMISLRDYIDKSGTLEGKYILENFSAPPFGWSPDTTRYILAAMLMAGDIKLKCSGREVTAAAQQAIDALKTNTAFKGIGVSLRMEKPSMDTLARASERMTELIGDTVLPLEAEISKAAAKHFPQFQHDYAPLAEKLESFSSSGLSLPGAERLRSMNQEIADVLSTDASDAPTRLGAEDSILYKNLKWAFKLKQALDNGLDETLKALLHHRQNILELPASGIPGDLKGEVSCSLDQLKERLQSEDFFTHQADFNTLLTHIKARVNEAAEALHMQLKEKVKAGVEDLQRLNEWAELDVEEQQNAISTLEGMVAGESMITHGQNGLQELKKRIAQSYDLGNEIESLKASIQQKGKERKKQRQEEAQADSGHTGASTYKKAIKVPLKLTTAMDLEALILQLQEIKTEMGHYANVEIVFDIQGK